ncbi:hypothetical protein EOPP23_15790 [Endozoicomonas sp. OPT23]|uniref:YaeQ family protein n=1 Tax=Endozoicomonas sp. OPT23 TaxID=2072845 RepID=UPI00129B7CF4|nr:YaeQ family protein [Endozoicomonas sp. OPT23]MRI34451.1 hypothetical protein [Endozoicomonas sp. OPT23]
MALKATIFKCDLQIADMDRHYYQNHLLTIARHPSETDERMMIRVMAFAFYASEQLSFTKGLSTDDEPDLWQKSLSDEIELWIDLGQPDEKRIRKACGRAKQAVLINYGGRTSDSWWQQNQNTLKRFNNLSVFDLPEQQGKELATLADRSMQLSVTIQDGHALVSSDAGSVDIQLKKRK